MNEYGIIVKCEQMVYRDDAKVRGIFSVYIGGDFSLKSSTEDKSAAGTMVIKGIKLIRHESGKFVVSYPHLYSGGHVNNLAFPITKELGSMIKDEILRLYQVEFDMMNQLVLAA